MILSKRLFIAVVLAAVLAITVLANKHLPAVSGFVALYACGDRFVSLRQNKQQVIADAVAASPFFAYTDIVINDDKQRVEVSLPLGIARQTAIFRAGLGCTLVIDTTEQQLHAEHKNYQLPTVDLSATPFAVAEKKPELEQVLDLAFTEPSATSQRNTRAIVVIKNGEIVAERYADGFDESSLLLGWSMTKSLLNTFAGILQKQNLLNIKEQQLFPYWQDQRSEISIENLLNMHSGLAFNEVYDFAKDATTMLFNSGDNSAFAAAMPLAHSPATVWSYSSGTSNILAHLLRRKVGTPAQFHQFMYQQLFIPLGMNSVIIQPDASGDIIGSSFMYATARDWARWGLLYLNNGNWEGEQIIPAQWVAYTREPLADSPMGNYKAQFWLNAGKPDDPSQRQFPKLPTDMYFASGHDAQQVLILPSENMVVVRLGRTLDKSWDTESFVNAVIGALR
ncbi:serine hydrolase [Oceanicoccus sp. KOV_DT_Chl]|uniref:serine hydrolase domain-containing protein n=1 Tax=Oceanicoccus sp. KOV_DT_Chl TaxID=1904639 RepID=UPI000C7C69E0|nr:serine hydrolase [Oceanicoccus sp. KOV_DT_Chl]